jgi:hypothetical protein
VEASEDILEPTGIMKTALATHVKQAAAAEQSFVFTQPCSTHSSTTERTMKSHLAKSSLIFFIVISGITAVLTASGAPADNSGTSALYAVEAFASDNVWAAGYAYEGNLSFPLVEHWDGTSWSIIPNPAGVLQSQMHGIAVVAPDDVWFVGQTWNTSDQAYILHWDGESLQSIPPANPSLYVSLWSVSAISANDVWAVGQSSNHTLTEHWDGSSWRVISSPTGSYDFLEGVTALAANNVWAVGYTSDASEILHWDGRRWTLSPSGTIGDYAGFRSISALAANDIWAIGFSEGTLTEHWDGTLWTRIPSPNPSPTGNSLYSVGAIGPNDVWTVGQAYGSPNHTLALHFDGAVWSQAVTPNLGRGFLANSLYGISPVASNDIWAVGIGQQAMTMHWDGRRWRVVSNPADH